MSHVLMRALLAVSLSVATAAAVAAESVAGETAPSVSTPAVSTPAVSAPAAPASNAAEIERMTGHLMTMLPIDRIFADALAEHANELKRELKPEQEACLRREVGSDALTARKRAEVLRFAQAHPTEFATGLKVLDDGAAAMIAKIVESTMGGEEYDMDKADPDALVAFMGFAFASEHAELRQLAGYGEFFGPNAGPESTIEPMMDALATEISKSCAIPARFFE